MKRWELWLQYAANLLVIGTGSVYAFMRYFLQPIDEWAVINHPWQPYVQHLHVLTAPLLVFACGLIWHRHVARRIGAEEHRRGGSGPGLAAALVPMIASGYLLQTTSATSWRQVWLVLHLASSGLWTLLVATHFLRWSKIRDRLGPLLAPPRSSVSSRSRTRW